jgi:hypothetical protein
MSSNMQTHTVDAHEQQFGGFLTPATGMSTPSVDIKMETISMARKALMGVRLTQVREKCSAMIIIATRPPVGFG